MGNKIYLTPKEQEIFSIVRDLKTPIVEISQIKDIFPDHENLNKTIHGLIKKGYFYKIHRGFYLVQAEPSHKPFIHDIYEIAQRLYKGYFAFSTALKLHGLIEYEPFTIFIATTLKPRELIIGEYTIKTVNYSKAGGLQNINGYHVSDIEKTFFDCFNKPQYSGSYYAITKALYDANINWDIFQSYFEKYGTDNLCQKTGYLLEQMKKNTDFGVPERIISYFRKRVRNNTKLLPKEKGRFIKEWKLIDNDQRFLEWYYGA